ncbi:diguanylate cyclase, partial [Photobacterium sp. BZF1]|uniref:putative bifunctional diguanylate cyclase/phosphodiesterase n=1 Tax=Photobacterium sp. BZF1 TaxID=1904457 RepID=UPI00165368D1
MKISIKQIIALFVILLTWFILALFYVSEKQNQIREEVINIDEQAFRLTQETNRLNVFVADYIFRQSPDSLEKWAKTLNSVEQQYEHLLLSANLNDHSISKRIEADIFRIRKQFSLLQGATSSNDTHWITINLNTYNQNLITHLNKLIKEIRKTATSELSKLTANQRIIFSIITTLAILLLAVIHSALIAPLKIVKHLLYRIGRGDKVIDFRKSHIQEWYQLTSDIESMYYDLKTTTVSKAALESEVEMRRTAEKNANTLARTDFLTGLPNRRRLSELFKLKKMQQEKLFLMFLDIDNFKSINDNLSHSVGDELLRCIGRLIEGQLNENDVVARIGGDEFAIIYLNNSKKRAMDLARDIRHKLSQPIQIANSTIRVRCSVGIATYPEDGAQANTLLANADTAMYYAKKHQVETSGIALYTTQIGNLSRDDFVINQQLKLAIEANEFDVWFQPQINIQTGLVEGFEALLRWRKKDGSFISPELFVPLLEESTDIVEVGNFVIDKAIEFHKRLLDTGYKLSVSINVSAVQLEHVDFITALHQKIISKGLTPEHFPLELTETAIFKNKHKALQSMQTLNELGFSLQL